MAENTDVVVIGGGYARVMATRVEAGRITGLYVVRNPEKLSRIESETPLALR